MRIWALTFIAVLFVPMGSIAVESPMKFIASKASDNTHMFLYRCNENGNVVEVKQHYNASADAEEIQFIVNNKASDWITLGNDPDRFNELGRKACEESTARFVSAANK